MQEAAYLHEYLRCHKVLQLQGFGRLERVELPATIDFANQQILPGMHRMLYSATVTEAHQFGEWLQQSYQLSTEAAAHWCSRFVASFQTQLQQQGSVNLPLIGVFRRHEGTVVFVPHAHPVQLLPNITAHRVIRKDAQHNIRVGDAERSNTEMQEWLHEQHTVRRSWWWAGALVLFLIALGSIWMYMRIHYVQWKHQGSYQPVPLQETPRQYQE